MDEPAEPALPLPPEASARPIQTMRPALPMDIVPRPRLLERAGALGRPGISLVVAPAGFGKTTLLAGWVDLAPVPVAWLSLDEEDRAFAVFVANLIAAVRSIAPGAAEPTLALLRAGSAPAASGKRLAGDLLATGAPLALMLDDWHAAATPEHDALIGALIRWLPSNLHLAIASRTMPEIPLAKPRALGLVAEVGPEALRFDQRETDAFLHGGGITGDPGGVWTMTEGWPVALRLYAAAGPDAEGIRPALPLTGQQALREYLFDEVLARRTEDDLTCIRRIALPERIDPALATHLCARDERESAALLQRLAVTDQLLTPLPDGSFRFHALVRAALLDRLLADEGLAVVDDLHHRAAGQFEARGEIDQAIRHLLAAGDDAAVAGLVERHALAALDRFNMSEVESWLRRLPPERIAASPMLLLAEVACAEYRTRFDDGIISLRRLDDLLAASPLPEPEQTWFTAASTILRAHMEGMAPDPEAGLATMSAALDLLGSGPGLFFRMIGTSDSMLALTSLGRHDEALDLLATARDTALADPASPAPAHLDNWRAVLLLTTARPDLAIPVARQALTRAETLGIGNATAIARLLLGMAHALRFEPEPAERFLRASLANRSRMGLDAEGDATMELALLLHLTGRHAEGVHLVETFIEEYGPVITAGIIRPVISFRARLALLQGDVAAARSWIDRLAAWPDAPSRAYSETLPLTAAHLAIAAGREQGDAARAILQGPIEQGEWVNEGVPAIRTNLLLALLEKESRRPRAAEGHIREAIALAAPGGTLEPFAEFQPALGRLISASGREGVRIAAAIEAATGPTALVATPADLLTVRERQVLDGLREGLSNKEIADELAISPFTVKRHTSEIYRKMGVASRAAAIDEAARRRIEPLAGPARS